MGRVELDEWIAQTAPKLAEDMIRWHGLARAQARARQHLDNRNLTPTQRAHWALICRWLGGD